MKEIDSTVIFNLNTPYHRNYTDSSTNGEIVVSYNNPLNERVIKDRTWVWKNACYAWTLKTVSWTIITHQITFHFQNQSTVFCVRCGTPRGIITHFFRSETHRDMAQWARSLVQGTHNTIHYQREFSFRCLFQVR